jgi:hypothetical protein
LRKGAAARDLRGSILHNAGGVGDPGPRSRGSSFLATPGFDTKSLWDKGFDTKSLRDKGFDTKSLWDKGFDKESLRDKELRRV